MPKTKGNGHFQDEGLIAIREAFADAQFFDIEAKEVSERIMLGQHRDKQIPDSMVMEIYGSITEGHKLELAFTSDAGNGYIAHIESYADMIKMLDGGLEAMLVLVDG